MLKQLLARRLLNWRGWSSDPRQSWLWRAAFTEGHSQHRLLRLRCDLVENHDEWGIVGVVTHAEKRTCEQPPPNKYSELAASYLDRIS